MVEFSNIQDNPDSANLIRLEADRGGPPEPPPKNKVEDPDSKNGDDRVVITGVPTLDVSQIIIQDVNEKIQELWAYLTNHIEERVQNNKQSIIDLTLTIKTYIAENNLRIVNIQGQIVKLTADATKEIVEETRTWMERLSETTHGFVTTVMEKEKKARDELVGSVTGAMNLLTGDFGNIGNLLSQGISTLVTDLYTGAMEVLSPILEFMWDILFALLQEAFKITAETWVEVEGMVTNIVEMMLKIQKRAWSAVEKGVDNLVETT